MASASAENLAKVKAWEDTFNNDVERMVNELYAPDCLLGGAPLGRDKFLKLERRVLSAAPRRKIEVARTHATDDVVVVEGVLLDPDRGPDWKLPFCAVLTFRDGQIISDYTYAEFSQWPGMH
jgi:ketosteroid isomerase-like protein